MKIGNSLQNDTKYRGMLKNTRMGRNGYFKH